MEKVKFPGKVLKIREPKILKIPNRTFVKTIEKKIQETLVIIQEHFEGE